MAKYRKKPVEVEAEQIRLNVIPMMTGGWMATNPFDAVEMIRPRWWKSPVPMLRTASGPVAVFPGDWICRQMVNGQYDYWPVKHDIFATTYAPVDQEVR